MGFSEVLLYHPGKLDWMAAGLPTEGEDQERLIGDVLDTSAPTCSPHEQLGDLAARLGDWAWCAVVGDDGVVLGGISSSLAAEQPDALAFEVAEPGPQTYRASLPASEMLETMQRSDQAHAFVSDPDGRFLGAVSLEVLIHDQHG